MSEQTRDNLLAEIAELRDEVASLQSSLSESEDENDKLTQENEKYRDRPEMLDAIDAFCDVVTRPTGQLVYTVPPTTEANRAILGLFDAINRNP